MRAGIIFLTLFLLLSLAATAALAVLYNSERQKKTVSPADCSPAEECPDCSPAEECPPISLCPDCPPCAEKECQKCPKCPPAEEGGPSECPVCEECHVDCKVCPEPVSFNLPSGWDYDSKTENVKGPIGGCLCLSDKPWYNSGGQYCGNKDCKFTIQNGKLTNKYPGYPAREDKDCICPNPSDKDIPFQNVMCTSGCQWTI